MIKKYIKTKRPPNITMLIKGLACEGAADVCAIADEMKKLM
jgi:hypothetical protein